MRLPMTDPKPQTAEAAQTNRHTPIDAPTQQHESRGSASAIIEAYALAARVIRSAGRHATAHRRQRPTAITHAADHCLLEIKL
jgi:hypothetical protein